MTKKRRKRASNSGEMTAEEMKRRGMFVPSKPTSYLGGAAEYAYIYKTAGGASGRTLASPEALIADAENREEESRQGVRDRRLLRIREQSAASKIPKRR